MDVILGICNLIVGQRVTDTDPWPTQIYWPIWPMTQWPGHCQLWPTLQNISPVF